MHKKTRIVIILFVLSFISLASLRNIDGQIKDDQSDDRRKLANAALKALWAAGKPNPSQIKDMLSKHDIGGLENIYDNYFRQYQKDVGYELLLHNAYLIFSPANNISLADLDFWVSKSDSYIAFAARGAYKKELGFIARGNKFISETRQDRIEDMEKLHREAAKDLQIAVDKNPLLTPAYFNLIEIAKASNMPFTPKEILDKAIDKDKRTYVVRQAYMNAITPNWGGSYEEMSAFGKQVAQFADINPVLWTFQGEMFAEQGRRYFNEMKYEQAIEPYTLALKFGDRTVWLKFRGQCLWRIGQEGKALEDLRKALYYNPDDKEAQNLVQNARRSAFEKGINPDPFIKR